MSTKETSMTNIMQSLTKFKAVEVATLVFVMRLKCSLNTTLPIVVHSSNYSYTGWPKNWHYFCMP